MDSEKDKLLKRDIVLSVARELYVQSLRHEGNMQIGVANPDTCIDAAILWADAEMAYREDMEEE